MSTLFDLSGKVAMIAGGAGYLGREACAALAEHGAAVAVADVRGQYATSFASELRERGHAANGIELDVADETSVAAAVRAVVEGFGRLDILVNLVTLLPGRTLDEGTIDDWQAGLRVSLSGAYALAREAAAVMARGDGGAIIHFASMYGMVSPDPRIYRGISSPNPPDYGAAKAGLIQLTRYQAVAWAPQKIRVNAIAPGPFPHPEGPHDHAEFHRRLTERVPLGRLGVAREIAGAVVFLASDASSYVTGVTLPVDGGWTAW